MKPPLAGPDQDTTAASASKPSPVTIYTIGYGSRTREELLELLRAHGVAYLIDVRSSPYSRYKPEFAREALEEFLNANQVRYVYMGDSIGGQPVDPSCYAPDGKVLYDRIKQKGFYLQGIERLERASGQGLRVAIMCSEGKPEACHRTKLIGETLAERDIPVAHIDENGRVITQADAVARLTDGQLSLFGDFDFKSRKKHGRAQGKPASGPLEEEDDDA